jgi:hypothetical protein
VNSTRTPVLLRSVEDLADAKELRSVIAAALISSPVDDAALRCAVWNFVGVERRAGVTPPRVNCRGARFFEPAQKQPPTNPHPQTTPRRCLVVEK